MTDRSPARDRLLKAAAELFYNDGVGATGIDTITARAGVAKMSLYNNFASKADLQQARELLERRGVKFSTREEADGDYILVVDASFDPLAGS